MGARGVITVEITGVTDRALENHQSLHALGSSPAFLLVSPTPNSAQV